MPGQASNARQVASLGESPADARRRMASAGRTEAEAPEPQGTEVQGPLTPQHLAAISAAEEGFKGEAASGGAVVEAPEKVEAPSAAKAVEMIQQLSQEKLQLLTERDAALNLVDRYKAQYGELD